MKQYISIGAISGGLSVILGAFTAHKLKAILSIEKFESLQVGIRYQMIHSLLLIIIFALPALSISQKKKIGNLILIGILLFSGSIYLLNSEIIPSKYLFFLTPIGGIFLFISWIMIAVYTLFSKEKK